MADLAGPECSPRVAPRRHGDLRRAISDALELCFVLLGGRRSYRRRHLSRGRFVMREELVEVDELPPGLEGFRLAQLSDLHGGPFLGAGDLREVVEAVNEQEPDLCVLTGDYICHRPAEALPLAEDLGRLRSRHGTFAVFGNHDYRDRREADIAARYAEVGVRFLRNESVRLDSGAGVLALTGLEDLEEGKVIDPRAARAALEEGDVEVMLCHNPLGARALARPGCAAILSGHTHGTQVDLPFLRDLGPEHPGLRVELGPTTLIVSRGLGVVGAPIRHRSPAEVVFVRLVRRSGGGG